MFQGCGWEPQADREAWWNNNDFEKKYKHKIMKHTRMGIIFNIKT